MTPAGTALAERIAEHARRTPDAVALVDTRGPLTYAELARRVAATARGLRGAGMRTGDTVLFAVRPGRDAAVLGLAVMTVGAVVVVADPGAGPELDAARGRLVGERLAAPAWLAAESWLAALAARRPGRALLHRFGLDLPALADPALRLVHTGPRLPGLPADSLAASSLSGSGPLPPADPDRPALVVFTSGTTARPRAVVHSQRTLLTGGDLLAASLGLPGAAEHVTVHSEQLMIAFAFLAAGTTWSVAPLPVRPARFLRDLRRRRATHTFGTPAALARLLDTGPLPDTLGTVLLGAAPVPPPVLRRLREALPAARITVVYGATEMLPIAVTDAGAKLAHAADGDLAGPPLPGVTARLGENGELLLTGPHLAIGYLGDGPLDELRTGDRARIDAQGRIVLVGRLKDMLIRGSFNLYPGLYEPAIDALPGIAEAVIVGVPDPQTADESVVLAVRPDGTLPEAALLRLLHRELPRTIDHAALPDLIRCVPEIPRRGRTEKPDRDRLRELLRNDPQP
ncbi:class I adenylate-forming enzyme family protein [Kitasatospora sp. NRRL B-11411]|uniref:class I adenylate-forming enzyme family protein n=1 Tax=Kitasatospora sp. NRRL B-11411 TaxID=1463822 RepID=UPI00068BF488|nr:class I adenylate-forming enzyme family protein [Kitasatospora sp. NRRL B-11411]